MASADDEMKTVVVYFLPSAEKNCTIHGLSERYYTARWFDPETGEYTMLEEKAKPEGGVFSTPTGDGMFTRLRKDRVLLLTAVS